MPRTETWAAPPESRGGHVPPDLFYPPNPHKIVLQMKSTQHGGYIRGSKIKMEDMPKNLAALGTEIFNVSPPPPPLYFGGAAPTLAHITHRLY